VAAQGGAVVVVAGQHVERRVEWREQLAHALVLGVGAVLGQVARHQYRVHVERERPHRFDRGGEPGRRVAVAPVGADVGVAQLDKSAPPVIRTAF
jgi:hypothetical protein